MRISVAALPASQSQSALNAKQRGVVARLLVLGCLYALAHVPAAGIAQIWITFAYDLGLLGVLLLLGWQIGDRGLHYLDPLTARWPGRPVLAITVGWGVISTTLLALGLAGLYYAPLLAALMAGALLITTPSAGPDWPEIARIVRAKAGSLRGGEGFVILACLVLIGGPIIALSVGIPLPVHDWDALAYHQMGVRLYLAHHAMIPLVHFPDADGPINTELLFLLGAAFGSDSFGQALVWGQDILIVILIVELGRRYWSPVVGWMAGALYLSIPIVSFMLTIPYNDNGLALGELGVMCGIARLTQRPTRRGAMTCGVLLGFTLGQKMSALPFLAATLTYALVLAVGNPFSRWRREETASKPEREQTLRLVGLIGMAIVIGLLIAAPWYIRNMVWFDNPFMPLQLKGAVQGAIPTPIYRSALGQATQPGVVTQVESAVTGFVQLFWSYVNPLFLLAVPGFLLRPRRLSVALGAAALVVYLIWLHYTPWNLPPRYLFAWIATMALATAAMLHWPAQVLRRKSLVLVGFLPVLAFASFNMFFQFFMLTHHTASWAYLTGAMSRDEFIRSGLSAYSAMQYLNRVDRTEPVALIGETRVYYLQPPSLPDWGWQAIASFEAQGSPQQAARTLWNEEARYVLAADSFLPTNSNRTSWTGTLREVYLIPLYRRDGFSVYRLRAPDSAALSLLSASQSDGRD